MLSRILQIFREDEKTCPPHQDSLDRNPLEQEDRAAGEHRGGGAQDSKAQCQDGAFLRHPLGVLRFNSILHDLPGDSVRAHR